MGGGVCGLYPCAEVKFLDLTLKDAWLRSSHPDVVRKSARESSHLTFLSRLTFIMWYSLTGTLCPSNYVDFPNTGMSCDLVPVLALLSGKRFSQTTQPIALPPSGKRRRCRKSSFQTQRRHLPKPLSQAFLCSASKPQRSCWHQPYHGGQQHLSKHLFLCWTVGFSRTNPMLCFTGCPSHSTRSFRILMYDVDWINWRD